MAMATWATKRKSTYLGGSLLFFIVVAIAFWHTFLYKPASCFDGIKNGNEEAIDCGGSCIRLCQSAFFPAKVAWGGAKFEKVAPGLYNAASYIENLNVSGAALNVPYKISFFDDTGLIIDERTGVVDIPPHRNTIAFQSAIDLGKRTPTKATFEFLKAPAWFKSEDPLGNLLIVDKKYAEDSTLNTSSLQVTLKNTGLVSLKNINVATVLYDIDGNAIGFSKTEIDSIAPGATEVAPFTWPMSRSGKVDVIEVLPEITPR